MTPDFTNPATWVIVFILALLVWWAGYAFKSASSQVKPGIADGSEFLGGLVFAVTAIGTLVAIGMTVYRALS